MGFWVLVELAAPGVSVLSTVPFESASTVVDGTSYIVSALDGSYQGSASAALVDGGRCLSTGSWAGKVVLCERGDISFADKAKNVANSGGVAAIIYNNVPGGFSGTLGSGAPAIPVVSMTQEDGQFLKGNKLGKTAAVSTVPNNQGNGYAFYDGTSMATPHVAGVAALIWSANPGWTNAQIREALAVTAEDLGSAGRDNAYGWGLIRADAALAYLQGGGGGDPDPVDVPPSNLSASVLKSKGKTTGVALGWTAGTASHVDVYRGASKIAAGIANGGSYTDDYVGAKRERVTYQVCMKDSTSACSNQVTVQF